MPRAEIVHGINAARVFFSSGDAEARIEVHHSTWHSGDRRGCQLFPCSEAHLLIPKNKDRKSLMRDVLKEGIAMLDGREFTPSEIQTWLASAKRAIR